MRKDRVNKNENAYTRLVEDLKNGDLSLLEIEVAVSVWINARKDLPQPIKNLLVQAGGGGIVRSLFKQMKDTIGNMELAYRRGQQKEKVN